MSTSHTSTIVIATPVKNSLKTAQKTIEMVAQCKRDAEYIVFDDFSDVETAEWLSRHAEIVGFTLLHASELGCDCSPNQRAFLRNLQKRAGSRHIVIVESDVLINGETLDALITAAESLEYPGLIGAVTIDDTGQICYPYTRLIQKKSDTVEIKTLSFCCTLLTHSFLASYDFNLLNVKKDWFDIFLSKKSRTLGFKNYILLNQKVVHYPHSSRPWKKDKYTNPCRYYMQKLLTGRDRI